MFFHVSWISRKEEIVGFQSEIEALKSGIDKMSTEKEDLLHKIEAGEGVSTALQQLKEENVRSPDNRSWWLVSNCFPILCGSLQISLTNQVKSQESNHKKLMEDSAKKVETLHSQLNESTKAMAIAQEKMLKLEQNLEERTVKLEHLQKSTAKLEADLQSKVRKTLEKLLPPT